MPPSLKLKSEIPGKIEAVHMNTRLFNDDGYDALVRNGRLLRAACVRVFATDFKQRGRCTAYRSSSAS